MYTADGGVNEADVGWTERPGNTMFEVEEGGMDDTMVFGFGGRLDGGAEVLRTGRGTDVS